MRLFDIVKGDTLVSSRAIQKFLPLFEDMQGMQVPVSLFCDSLLLAMTGVNLYLQICFDNRMWRGGIVGVEMLGFPGHFQLMGRVGLPSVGHPQMPLCSLANRGG